MPVRPRVVRRPWSVAGVLLAVLLVASCDGGVNLPNITPTGTIPVPSITLPSRPTPTVTLPARPTPTVTLPVVPEPSAPPVATEEPAPPVEPTTEPTEPAVVPEPAPSTPAPEPTPTPTPTPTEEVASPSPSATVDDVVESDDAGTPAWVWWLVGLVVVGAAVGIPLAVRARRRAA